MRILVAGIRETERVRTVEELGRCAINATVEVCGSVAEARALAARAPLPAVVLAAPALPDGGPSELLRVLSATDESPLVIVIGAYPKEPAALAAAYREGIFDWVDTASNGEFTRALDRAFQECESRRHHRQAEAQLRESEERFRIASKLVSDYVYSVRVEGKFQIESQTEYSEHTMEWATGAFEQVTGYTLDEVSVLGWPTLVHPDDIPAAVQFSERLARGEKSVLEYRIRHKDGAYRWLHDVCQPVWDPEKNQICRLLGGVQDITERKHAETALRESRALLHSVFRVQSSFIEHAEDEEVFTELLSGMLVLAQCACALVLEYDDRGKDYFAHTLARDGIGAGESTRRRVPAASQLGHLFDALHTHTPLICNGGAQLEGPPASWLDLTKAENFLAAPLVRSGRTHGLMVLVDRAEGFTEANLHYLRPLLATCGGILAARKQARLRHAAEESLRESEARWRFALEGNADGVWDYRIAKQRIYFSPVWKQMLGYADHEIGDTLEEWFERMHPDDIAPTLERLQQYIRGELPIFEIDYRMRHKDGTYRWIHDLGMVMERAPDGSPTRMVGTHRDVTAAYKAEEDRVAMELQVIQSQKLESLGILAGGIAHDFNNILTSVIGYTDLVLVDLPADSPIRARLQSVLLGARRAADLTRQLLAYSGKGQFVLQPVNIAEVVRESCQLMRVSLPQPAHMIQELKEELPAAIGDPTQIRQVLISLLTNATEALPDGPSTVTVRTGTAPFSREGFSIIQAPEEPAKEPYIFIDVADTGSGMDAETLQRIFDPFFSTKFAGRGLGLASSLGIVRSHHGAILVRSEVGVGTTFRVMLPASGAPVPPAPVPPPNAPWRTHGTALVIDDEPAVRALASSLLERLGFVVLTAETGEEGVELFRAHAADVDLVLLDLSLPGMDGAEVYEVLKQLRADVRVLMTSGYSEQFAERRFGPGGPVGFVQKPYRVGEFSAAIQAAMEGAQVAVHTP